MLADYLARGLKAGLVAGIAFGLFVVVVGNPLVGLADDMAVDHDHAGAADTEASVLSMAVDNAVSVAGAVVWGLLAGVVVFGVGYYFLEPVVPGAPDSQSYLLAGAGFVIASGAPWLVLPPQPAGVAQALPVGERIGWYVAMMAAGALVCGLAGYGYLRVEQSKGPLPALLAAVVPFALLAVPVAIAPANPVDGTPDQALVATFRGFVVFGQLALWFVMASAHAWLVTRAQGGHSDEWTSADPTGATSAN